MVLSGGNDLAGAPYPNVDKGEEVLYCGTDSSDGQTATGTKRLLESVRNAQPVRLIRSSNLRSPYAPELGFRYVYHVLRWLMRELVWRAPSLVHNVHSLTLG